MRSPIRRRRYAAPARPAALLLAAGLLAAGCGGADDSGGGTTEAAGVALVDQHGVRLQPTGARGPHPFTASTVRPSPQRPAAPAQRVSEGPGPVTVPGSTPGLYGGTPSVADCDVERQADLLTVDDAKAEAFARAAGIGPAGIGSWLRDLTPVLLRADTRVTGHGYRDGSPVPYQTVLQAGTAVLVDQYGAPRVRCACGGPLRSPVLDGGGAARSGTGRNGTEPSGTRPGGTAGAAGAAAVAAGPPQPGGTAGGRATPWAGYRPGRVVIVTPTQQVVHSLLIVNLRDNTWLERLTGTGGARDRRPEAPPPYAPGERDLAASAGTAPPQDLGAVAPTDCPTSIGGTRTVPPGCPTPPPPPSPPVLPAPDGAGGVPDTGQVPDAPSAPEIPDTPVAPDVQEAPGAPPDSGGAPDGGLPDGGGGPDGGPDGGVPDGPEGPSGSGAPDATGTPDDLGPLADSEVPDTAGEPEGMPFQPDPYEG
ncbi:DUF6777 domain-containing protein [Streptomyces lavendulocolor]|uniref:DUF6777 domain-containing protein n=1 Tax=Streptomyces lavendulocolor TaxID=67316 RepID=UPI003C307F9F